MTEDDRPARRGLARLAELGPVWITALAGLIVALTGAGFFAGQATASNNASQAPATKTIVSTVTVPAAGTTSGSAASAGDQATASNTADGTQLAAYSINLSGGYFAPLGPTAPTQSQFVTNNLTGNDIYFSGSSFQPDGQDKMVSLPVGSTPDYQACANGTEFESSANATVGAAFCIVEAGRVAGVSVSGITTGQSAYATLKVTVWQNSGA